MQHPGPKADVHRYLKVAGEAVLWKLDGLSEYDIRRPMTATGTNLLGLVKHLSFVEQGYFGDTFDRPMADALPWLHDEEEPNADMWATPAESREYIVDRYLRSAQHADTTIEALALDAVGRVPWWPADRREVTLHRVLVHVVAETHRHAGHADIVRELMDGAVGLRAENDNLAIPDGDAWAPYRQRLERAARLASGVSD